MSPHANSPKMPLETNFPTLPLRVYQLHPNDENSTPPKTLPSGNPTRLNNPSIKNFHLAIRVLQLVFAFAAGICYTIELFYGNTASQFIYAQVVCGLTLILLAIQGKTTTSPYLLALVVEWVLCILWLALFGVFSVVMYIDETASEKVHAWDLSVESMKAAVCMDFISFLLWMVSAVFATAMWCSGARAWIRRKTGREGWKDMESFDGVKKGMESESTEAITRDCLPLYENSTSTRGFH